MKTGSAGIETNLCFQPATLQSSRKLVTKENLLHGHGFGHGFGVKKVIPGTRRSGGKRG